MESDEESRVSDGDLVLEGERGDSDEEKNNTNNTSNTNNNTVNSSSNVNQDHLKQFVEQLAESQLQNQLKASYPASLLVSACFTFISSVFYKVCSFAVQQLVQEWFTVTIILLLIFCELS